MSSSDLFSLDIVPGLFTEQSERVSTRRWIDGNRVRFFNGLPEKMGGWLKVLTLSDVTGVVRNMVSWSQLDGSSLAAFGANTGVWLVTADDTVTNITPARRATTGLGGAESALTNPFTSVDTSTTVTVTHTSHGAIQEDYVEFDNATGFNGIPGNDLNKTHQISKIVDADSYEIIVATAATSSGTAGGTVDYAYDINAGQISTIAGKGWGLGRWNRDRDGWNLPLNFDVEPGDAKVLIPARTWALVPWGEDLILSPRRGQVYVYDSSAGGRATLITEVPGPGEHIVLSESEQQIFVLGCIPPGGSASDPMYIRWCDSRDYTVWTASAANSAGGFRIDQGNFILCGVQIGRSILVFTDTSLYHLFPAPSPVYYGKKHLGKTSLVSPNAVTEYQGIGYWMGANNFYIFTGVPRVLPCDVHSKIFGDINKEQLDKVVCGTNHRFNEIIWFYPSADSTEINRYVTFNTAENLWSFGDMSRTAWRDNEYRFDKPYAINSDSEVFLHEEGSTDDGAAMGEYLTSYAFDIRLGGVSNTRKILKIDTIVPDFEILNSSIQLYLQKRKWPHKLMYESGPFEIRSDTDLINPRVRGRQIKLRLVGLGGGFWRFANFRIGGYEDGDR